jgi:agmatinase
MPSPEPPEWLDALRPAGAATFLRLPGREALDAAGAAVVGVPGEAGARRPGARFAPTALRRASASVDPYNSMLGLDPVERLRPVDLGDLRAAAGPSEAWIAGAAAVIEAASRAGVRPVVLGGDATVALALLRGVAAAHGPVGAVALDARPGLRRPGARPPGRADALGRALVEGTLDPARTLVAGERGGLAAVGDAGLAAAHGVAALTTEELVAAGPGGFSLRARERVGARPCVLAVDLSIVDPGFVPGAADPVAGGLSSREALTLVRSLAGVDVRGFVCTGLVPELDTGGVGALVGASLVLEMLTVAAFLAPLPAGSPGAAPTPGEPPGA